MPRPPAPRAPTKKKSLHATERDTPRVAQARAAYRQRTASLDLRRVKFVDEASVNLAMTRLYGRAPRGDRSVGTSPLHYRANISLLSALGSDGLQTVMPVEGATDANVFRTYVKQVLGPTLAPGHIVVLDNLSVHKAPGIQQALARRRARLLYLPLGAPDLSPMERCLSKVKIALRAVKARTREALDVAVQQAMETVTVIDVRNWLSHCGYAV